MPDPAAPHLDADAIRALVAEVLRRVVGALPAEAPAPSAPPAGPATVALGDAVVALAHVDRLPPGTRDVVIPPRAVITPSARDRARDLGISFRRAAAVASPGPARPFVVAQAECRGDAGGVAAAIARGVPQAQRLPAAGLADAVAALATHASRDGARGVLLTSRVAVAIVLANRSASLRAVTGRDAATLAAAAADCGANLAVIDPAAFVGGPAQACVDFTARAGAAVPPELAQAAPGCGCTSHQGPTP